MISYLKTFFILYLFTVTLLDFFENNIYAKENIFIENAYIPIFYEKQLSAAGYFSLKNNTNKNLKIISIKSNFGNATFHNSMINEEGIAKMIEIPSVELPSKSTINFEPNKMHIMFSNINNYKDIETIKVFLLFDDETEIQIPFKIISNIYNQKKF